MKKSTREKIGNATKGLIKLTDEQKSAIVQCFEENDIEKIKQIERFVSRRALFELTGRDEYAPKNKNRYNTLSLEKILFSF